MPGVNVNDDKYEKLAKQSVLRSLDDKIRVFEGIKSGHNMVPQLPLRIFLGADYTAKIFGTDSPEAAQMSSALGALLPLAKEFLTSANQQRCLPAVESALPVLRATRARIEGWTAENVAKTLGLNVLVLAAFEAATQGGVYNPQLTNIFRGPDSHN
jgi:hypothetical protein